MQLKSNSLGKFFMGMTMACVALLPTSLGSQATGTIDEINVGTHIYGAPIDKKALMGKVVVMELWGMG